MDTASRPALQAQVATSSPHLHLSHTPPLCYHLPEHSKAQLQPWYQVTQIKNCLEPSQHQGPDAKGENSGLRPLQFAAWKFSQSE